MLVSLLALHKNSCKPCEEETTSFFCRYLVLLVCWFVVQVVNFHDGYNGWAICLLGLGPDSGTFVNI